MSFLTTARRAFRYPNLAQAADVSVIVQNLANDVDAVVVAFTQAVFASRPAAGTSGTLFYATDTNVLYYDDGSAWHSVGAISAGSITLAMMAANSVDSSKIVDASIVAGDIANDTITATQIAANAITASELADNAVDTAAILANAVTAAKIANDTITATQIAADAIGSSELANNAVDTAAIAAGAVTPGKLDHFALRGPDDSSVYRVQIGVVFLPSYAADGGGGVTRSYSFPAAFASTPVVAIGGNGSPVWIQPGSVNASGFALSNGFSLGDANHMYIAIGLA